MVRKVSFEYNLISPFDYQDLEIQALQQAKSLTFMAPSSRQLGICLKLKQMFMRALKQNINNRNQDGASQAPISNSGSDFDAEMVELAFLMSDSVDLEEVHNLFKKLIVSSNDKSTYRGVCIVDNKTLLTEALYNEISADDIQSILGEYIANFLVPSQLMKKT